jgi:predicted PurR-regulated permease PerM
MASSRRMVLPARHTAEVGTAPTQRRSHDPSRQVVVGLLAVIAVILIAAALQAAAVVMMPLAFAFFVVVLVHPVEEFLAARLPARLQWLSLVLSMLLVVSALALAVALIWLTFLPVMERAPDYLDRLQDQFTALRTWAGERGLSLPPDFDLSSTLWRNAAQPLVWGLASAGEVLVFLALVFFFTLLMLIEASTWRRKTEAALRRRQTVAVLETVAAIAHKVRWFVLIRTLVSLIAALAQGTWLWLMGVDFAPFCAVLIFFLNYLPNIGSIIAVTLATLLAFVQFGLGWAGVIMAGLIAIDQVLGNFLDPRLQGRTLDVSALVVLLAVIFWAWLWGIAGAFLAVPLTVTIILVCAHVPTLEPIAVLLGGGADDAEADAR